MSWEWTEPTREALRAFLAARGICSGPLRTQRIGDGHSNLTYLVDDGSRAVVVRRPPPPPVPPGGHDVLREARVIAALAGSDVPVPEVLAVAQEGEVLDVPFYVMSHVEGVVVTTETPPALRTAQLRRGVGEALLDTLVALHAVDWRARGLEGFGRPEGFNRRHLRRMAGLASDEHGELPPPFVPLAAWLEEHAPPETGASIVHSDLRIGNVIFAAQPPPRVAAVLDWELATIGDPLLDLGYLLASHPEPGRPLTATERLSAAMLEPGYPSREQLAQRYADATGADLSNLHWYVAMNLLKLAALYEYGRRRAATGAGDPYYADEGHVRLFLEAAHRAGGIDLAVPVR